MKKGEQLELGARDVWVDRLEKEFSIKLLPLLDKSFPVDKCREVAKSLAELAARRAREAKVLPSLTMSARCVGCDAEVDVKDAAFLCAGCVVGIRSAGSDG